MRRLLIFLGGIISAIGAVWAAYDQNKLSERLEAKNEEIVALNRTLQNSVTGGDSFCYLAISREASPLFSVIHQGDSPLYDIALQLVDLQKLEQLNKSQTTIDILSSRVCITVGNMSPNSSTLLGAVGFDATVDRFLANVFFSARNGFFTQELRARKLANGIWTSATRITKTPSATPEPLLLKIQDDYPVSDDEEVKGWTGHK